MAELDSGAERYELCREVGRGGGGRVYLARDSLRGETVALKALRVEGDRRARVAREIDALSRLDHPGIVRYRDHGTTESGAVFLVTEWVEGETLAGRLVRAPLVVGETVAVGRAVAEALAFVHAEGLVHRDVKPSNLMLPDGRAAAAKLIDFGLVRSVEDDHGMTRTGVALGTYAYMSPEQAVGSRDIGAATDVYSLGAVLFECLTGRRLVGAQDQGAVFIKVIFDEAPRVGALVEGVPGELEELVARMLHKDPAARPTSAEVARELAGIHLGPGDDRVPRRTAVSLTEGEHRVVSLVLVAAVCEPGDTENATPQSSGPLSVLRRTAAAHGGRAELLVDGSGVVLHGETAAASEAAVAAARSALALHRELPGRAVAVTTGPLRQEGSAPAGGVVERAVRLCDGEDARIRIDDATAALLPGRFVVSGRGDDRELREERESGRPLRLVLGKPTTFVGRAMELGMLRAVARAAFAERMARTILVTGEAGAGKSRLWHELVEELGAGGPLQLWVGRGDPMRTASPLAMLAHALRGVLGVHPAGASHRSFRSRVADHGVENADRVAAFLGELCGVPFPGDGRPWLRDARSDPQRMADEIGQAFEALVAAASARGPLLLVLEDLHSGDAASLRMIERAIHARPDQPFLVLAVGRPAARDLLTGRGLRLDVQEVRVGPLATRDASALVRQVLGDHTLDATVSRLAARAEGNPFFLEELIRAEADGRPGVVPDTVLAVVQARLAAMEPEARRVLRAASIFGDVFWGGGVSALLGGAPVADWIRSLAAREVIVRRGGSRLDLQEEHAFRHALVREAAYAMLTEEDRALGHRLAAEWLLGAGERDAATLAGHFEKGGAAARAAEQYERAAAEALDRGDAARSLEHVARGIALGVAGAALGRFHAVAAFAHRTAGRAEEALESAREALLRLPPGEDDHHRAGATLAWALAAIGGVDRLRRHASEMLAATPASGDVRSAVRTFAELTEHLASTGQLALAGTALARAEAAASGSDPVLSGHVRVARGYYHVQRGEPGEAIDAYERAMAELDLGGSVRARIRARGSVASVYANVGAYERAEQVLREAIPLAEEAGIDGLHLLLSLNLGRVLGRLGRIEEARARTTSAARHFEARGDRRMGAAAHIYAADVLRGSGELATAEAHARAALAMAATSPPVRVYALAIGATVLLDADRAEEALCLAAQGVALLAEIGGAEEAEHLVRIAYARSLLATGRTAEADRALGEACRLLHAQAATIRDAELRRGFLERVEEHACLLTLAASRRV